MHARTTNPIQFIACRNSGFCRTNSCPCRPSLHVIDDCEVKRMFGCPPKRATPSVALPKLFLFWPWLATTQTTVAPNLRRRILAPQLRRDFVLGVAVAVTAFAGTKQQPHNWWPPQSVAWLASAGTKHQPSSRWQPHVWHGGRRPATKQLLRNTNFHRIGFINTSSL